MADECSSCGKEVKWVDLFRCEKCDANICEQCVVQEGDLQLCPRCAGGGG